MKHYLCGILGSFIFTFGTSYADAQTGEQMDAIQKLLRNEEGETAELVKGLIGKTDTNRLFYFPTFDEPATPKKWDVKYEDIFIPSTNETKLHGWYMHTNKESPLGTIVFSHGNAGSLGHHLGFVSWMVTAGYDVFMYDYRGFGKSTGQLDRKGMIDDVKSAISYVRGRKDVKKIISYGHSLGGAKSIAAFSDPHLKPVMAIIIDGAFSSYQDMARILAGDLGSSLISDEFSPNQLIKNIHKTPLLVVHGDRDAVVPISQGKELFDLANEPKTYFEVKGGGHGDALSRGNGEYRKKLLDWLAHKL